MSTALLLLALLEPAAPPPAAFWWASGHRAVAIVATTMLTPSAKARVRELLREASLPSVATWADSIQSRLKETSPWHYVNIPLAATDYDPVRDCPDNDCVVEAIRFQRAVLANFDAPRGARLEALKYLVHFIGDLHQPLHASDNGDRGGNLIEVDLMNRHRVKLHAVWDGEMFEVAGVSEAELVNRIAAETEANRARWDGGDVVEWALETHELARTTAYVVPVTRVLDAPYVTANVPIAIGQLARAAVRLAAVLNRALDP